jgi:hypothetical protein
VAGAGRFPLALPDQPRQRRWSSDHAAAAGPGSRKGCEAFDHVAGDRLGLLEVVGVGRLIAGLDHHHPALAIADQINLECQAGGTALQHLEGPLEVVEPLAPADITPA